MKESPVLLAMLALAMTTAGIAAAAIMNRAPHADPTVGSHHTSSGFRNVEGPRSPGFTDFLKWRWDRWSMDIPAADSYHFEPFPDAARVLESMAGENTLTWIGHATVLLRLNGKNILTDPQFSDRASPVSFAGPKRVARPGLSLDELPVIHAVVLSHDHYDSLDTETVRRLRARPGGEDTVFFAPLGLKEWFEAVGVTNVKEMDWWERESRFGLEFICVPVHHWSQRVPLVRNKTLWSGWVVRSTDFSFLFAGDSGYTTHFKEIGERLGPFDLAAIPIGAYEPRWFMKYHHLSPEDAVAVHRDVKAKRSVGVHWGTFILTDEPLTEPPQRLEQAKAAEGLNRDEFITLQHGETIPMGNGRIRKARESGG